MFILRQVDDFAIAASNTNEINMLLDRIDSHLKQKMKRQGLLTSFNGIDIEQSLDFIKILCEKYIDKILDAHKWNSHGRTTVTTPMANKTKTLHELATSIGPVDTKEAVQLQLKHKFSYRQAIGELMFAAVTCRPDIIFATIYLSQFSVHPALCHYSAVKRIFRYLRSTKSDRIHYWRIQPIHSLQKSTKPSMLADNHNVKLPTPNHRFPWAFSDAN